MRDPSDTPEVKDLSLISKNVLRKVFFRSLAMEANFNFETWQNTGFAFSIIPVLRKLYTSKETIAKALKGTFSFLIPPHMDQH